MRLIDADELKRSISQNNKIPRIFQQVINAQPTVYDMDKVVEELQKLKEKHGKLGVRTNEKGKKYISNKVQYGIHVGIINSINTVKAGGENEG